MNYLHLIDSFPPTSPVSITSSPRTLPSPTNNFPASSNFHVKNYIFSSSFIPTSKFRSAILMSRTSREISPTIRLSITRTSRLNLAGSVNPICALTSSTEILTRLHSAKKWNVSSGRGVAGACMGEKHACRPAGLPPASSGKYCWGLV